MKGLLLRRVDWGDVVARRSHGVDPETLAAAADIVSNVRHGGVPTLLSYAARFDGWSPSTAWIYDRADLRRAVDAIDRESRGVLERTASRIATFAKAQRGALTDISVALPHGEAGHEVLPMDRAGCYAPAGRYPLPSSLLMTAVTARVAGVSEVVVATPAPSSLMLAAAAIADADMVMGFGGAHAIAALAYGVGVDGCDVVVGPGSRWVTAAKKCVAGDVAIDMLAGPSELVVVMDETADPSLVAADLIAQAEHDLDAFTALVATDGTLIDAVEAELGVQLSTLPTSDIARAALTNTMAVVCRDPAEIAGLCDALAPEHLQLSVRAPDDLAARCRHAGACFLGECSAEVFGDYGIGANHVLPTGGGARFAGGLSVLSFLRVRTWLRITDAAGATADVAALARLEGLEGHARAAERRAG